MYVFLSAAVRASLLVCCARAEEPGLPYVHEPNLVYAEAHGTGLLMDVFTPTGKTNGLAIVDVVSGAWNSDRRKLMDHMIAQVFTTYCSHGYTVFAVRPGSKSRYTASEMVANVKTAIRYVKQNSSKYGIDPKRIGLTGASAGGHLACLVAVTAEPPQGNSKNSLEAQSTEVAAVAVFFPPTDFLDWNGREAGLNLLADLIFVAGNSGENSPSPEIIREKARLISPARLVSSNAPPFLIVHGDADPLVPLQQSKRMIGALKQAGGSAELVVKKGGGHPWFTIHEEVKVMANWFDKQLENPGNGARASKPN